MLAATSGADISLAAAAWVAGGFAGLALIMTGKGLRSETSERRRLADRQNKLDEMREWLAISEQARHVGAYTLGGGLDPVVVRIVNASLLPIAKVEAVAKAAEHRLPLFGHEGILMIVHPGVTAESRPVRPPVDGISWHMELAFNDDSGRRWHKYGPEPLREVPADFSLFAPAP